jgi:hypothetical protein
MMNIRREIMKKWSHKFVLFITIFGLSNLFLFGSQTIKAYADGTETLGTSSVTIASGTGMVAAGTGLAEQPGSISFSIPEEDTVKQVLLYWEGQDFDSFTGDDTIIVENNEVFGTQIGGPIFWTLGYGVSATYRSDITSLGLVEPGENTLSIEGLDFTKFANGVGVLVITDNGSPLSDIAVRDGHDLAYIDWQSPQDTTVPQTFTFDASEEERIAELTMFVSAVSGSNSTYGFRPTAIDIIVGDVTVTYDNLLDSIDGQEWDTVVLDVVIPAGETMLTVQVLSVDNLGIGGLPASLIWNVAALSVPSFGGGEGCTPGYWKQKQHFFAWEEYQTDTLFSEVFDDAFPGMTLLKVMRQGGGGLNALGRHAVAALLNASSHDTNYDFTVDEVIADFNSAFPGSKEDYELAKDIFQYYNEQGCPLGNGKEAVETNDSSDHTSIINTTEHSLDESNRGSSSSGGCFISAIAEYI